MKNLRTVHTFEKHQMFMRWKICAHFFSERFFTKLCGRLIENACRISALKTHNLAFIRARRLVNLWLSSLSGSWVSHIGAWTMFVLRSRACRVKATPAAIGSTGVCCWCTNKLFVLFYLFTTLQLFCVFFAIYCNTCSKLVLLNDTWIFY